MKPIDYRNATWNEVRQHIVGDRLRVLEALRIHGPCTTRQLAQAMGMDILSVRPRVTELVQLDFATVVPPRQSSLATGREGIYAARSEPDAWDSFHARKEAARNPQLNLGLTITH